MAIHIGLSPEAQVQRNAQKRNAKLTAIFISFVMTALLVATLSFVALSPFFNNQKNLITYSSGTAIEDDIARPEATNEVKKKPSSPSSSMAKVIAANTPSPVSILVPTNTADEPSLDFGNGNDFGSGWGSGSGDGAGSGSSGGFGLPSALQKRCSAKDRISRLIKGGGKEIYEDQVVNALRWLKSTQSADGSWSAQNKPVGMTGLALLAYLGHCETPQSEEFGETVQNAILYLVNASQQQDGKLATTTSYKQWCYEHAIATYALAEAFTLCQEFEIAIPNLMETVMAAGEHIIDNQHNSGGWDYSYDTSGKRGGDTSIVCWHLQALKACKTTGLEFSAIDKAAKAGIEYLEGAKNGKGTIGYGTNGKNNKNGPTMTPGAALCFQQWGKGKQSFAKNAAGWVIDNMDFDYHSSADLYMHYYSSQVAINAQGSGWKKYNQKVMTNLAGSQNTDGSWAIPGDPVHSMNSTHYATCLSVLMMEVYYRFLPSSEEN